MEPKGENRIFITELLIQPGIKSQIEEQRRIVLRYFGFENNIKVAEESGKKRIGTLSPMDMSKRK